MAVDLLKLETVGHDEASFGYKTVPASWLIGHLCEEADVCIHCPGENAVEMHAASYEFGQGLLVADANGNVFRLRVYAELVKRGIGPRCDLAYYQAGMAELEQLNSELSSEPLPKLTSIVGYDLAVDLDAPNFSAD
jgi:hypothetical protein